jgi:CheY-like chemotaxis protein
MTAITIGTAEEYGRLLLALLVDSDFDTREMYAEFLRQNACDIDEAENGPEALAKAIARHPDVIVTETRLPGINGFELCRLLREDASTRNIPIVVVTGDAYERDVRRVQNAGADAVLVKPCLPQRLMEEICRALKEKGSEPVTQLDGSSASAHANARRVRLSRAHLRGDTTAPPMPPPILHCPFCDRALTYIKSHIGGVSERHAEQWDDFACSTGCGDFQYRQRTRKLRHVA